MAVIFGGMVDGLHRAADRAARGPRVRSMPLHIAGALGKLQAVDFSLDPSRRYTVWTGLLGGLFLCALLFRHRPIAGAALHRRRLAAREPPRADVQRAAEDPDAVPHPAARRACVRLLPVRAARRCSSTRPNGGVTRKARTAGIPRPRKTTCRRRRADSEKAIRAWLQARTSDDPAMEAGARAAMVAANRPDRCRPRRGQGRARWRPIRAPRPRTPTTSSSRSF